MIITLPLCRCQRHCGDVPEEKDFWSQCKGLPPVGLPTEVPTEVPTDEANRSEPNADVVNRVCGDFVGTWPPEGPNPYAPGEI